MIAVRRRRKEEIPTVDEAAETLTQAETALARWESEAAGKAREAEALAAELVERQARAGEDLLDDAEWESVTAALSGMAERLASLETQQRLAVQAADAARGQVDPARRDLLRARAGTLKAQAAELREAAAVRQAKTDQLLAALADWEGTSFQPAVVRSVGGGTFHNRTRTQAALDQADALVKEANSLIKLAADGRPEQVRQRAGRALPAVSDVARLVLDSVRS
ncbi:hypothetical protein ACN27G_27625 [Plantactinospora sp. WMMB334]|uniref:hypothetical protein n=1 Tax=Plantactinospora sp. WMMB334 TaxID=3404119 RepID=UPI003B954037